MLNKRVFAAAVISLSLAIPTVASQATEAQAQPAMVAQNQVNDATKQVVVNPVKVGDTVITGKVLLQAGHKSQNVSILFDARAHQQTAVASRDESFGDDLVSFESPIPSLYSLQPGETITVGIAGKPDTFKKVVVEAATTPAPGTSPEQAPGTENTPGGELTPGGDNNPGQNPGATPKPPQGPGVGNGGMMLGSSGSSNLFG
ncbi:hypothetical protein [Corynebacterium propinquum]|uniref:hypothetical protein n=1 Tax=Corynebacterium propinquum TaxID=43769 RepID=UPI002540B50B|nr:hypothetical protein [Corynebacterium propinquum]MDK4257310.1 hypothetical protein [Corynebacterium propinquum]MDK4282367.1 hypothetical protein [Corynebacterium propinquum]MDK4298506.1 hypothetical protein [Corynebacterium propinquum]WKS32592.1 hypothetical protein NLL45_03100 [Corynebacterium propinquum]WKS36647.1 hypothetical protein NLL30_01520 [Corynebacterium propinquum]